MAGVTPNIRLNLPTYDQPGWDTLINANLQILDSLVARSISLTGAYVGIYSPGASYLINQTVTDPFDSSLWQANSGFTTLVTNTFAQERVANPSHWTNVTAATTSAGASATLAAGSATAANVSAVAAAASQSSATTSATNAAASAAAAVTGASFGNVGRNLFHNGLFRVAQRGLGPFTTNNAMSLDRWLLGSSIDTISVTSVAALDAARTAIGDEEAGTYLNYVCTSAGAAGSYSLLIQRLENVRKLANKTVTLSFYANASVNGLKVGASISQIFGAGGSAFVPSNGSNVTLSTVWTRYSITLTVPSIIGKTIGAGNDHYTEIDIWLSAGSTNNIRSGSVGVQSGTFQFWGMQLEVNASASSLEKVDNALDFVNCQRFYELGTTNVRQYINSLIVTIAAMQQFSVAKRIIPTIAFGTVTYTNASAAGSDTVQINGFRIIGTSGNASTFADFTVPWTASADL